MTTERVERAARELQEALNEDGRQYEIDVRKLDRTNMDDTSRRYRYDIGVTLVVRVL